MDGFNMAWGCLMVPLVLFLILIAFGSCIK